MLKKFLSPPSLKQPWTNSLTCIWKYKTQATAEEPNHHRGTHPLPPPYPLQLVWEANNPTQMQSNTKTNMRACNKSTNPNRKFAGRVGLHRKLESLILLESANAQ
ncbi:hypothetical protein AMTR_s00038p00122500 [Amborella trichopoda]|uniref:Uncharacterized protein n=1 Tax=Amborella trichopoda TaxID=13333 RepID=U5CN48_AMBTC|nr:hypothetical protein AMTR_s00038p00122500 [Amborella trichopoda]